MVTVEGLWVGELVLIDILLEWLQRAEAAEWEKITGDLDTAKASFIVGTETWAKSTSIPNRFISSTTSWNSRRRKTQINQPHLEFESDYKIGEHRRDWVNGVNFRFYKQTGKSDNNGGKETQLTGIYAAGSAGPRARSWNGLHWTWRVVWCGEHGFDQELFMLWEVGAPTNNYGLSRTRNYWQYICKSTAVT